MQIMKRAQWSLESCNHQGETVLNGRNNVTVGFLSFCGEKNQVISTAGMRMWGMPRSHLFG